jgi:hypothetical protein
MEAFTGGVANFPGPDDEIEDLVRAQFGDSRELARSFAETYKSERVVVQTTIGVGLLLVCGAAVTAVVSSGQASAALVIGLPLGRAFGGCLGNSAASRH